MWSCAVTIFALITWVSYEIMQIDWDNQTVDSLINSYMRPSWALAVGWIIFACHNGYGGTTQHNTVQIILEDNILL